ncbi:dihydrofolate reductase [Chytriomyces hyalinus]|nr:dihydrofolate reductase [Chytriomyces hyalinus]
MDARIHLVVAAASHNHAIGSNGLLPWRLKGDMLFFQLMTTYFGIPPSTLDATPPDTPNYVIMGRRTWESIPSKFRPLPNRTNLILSRNPDFARNNPSLLTFATLDAAITHAKGSNPTTSSIFVIGGASVYAETLARPDCGYVFYTNVQVPQQVLNDIKFDVFMPAEFTNGSAFRRLTNEEVLSTILPKRVVAECCNGGDLTVSENGFQYEYQVYVRNNL